MNKRINPFEYEAANNLEQRDIIDFYIEDYNFSRFIQSTKNIFLVGERGSGKTMALLYNSFPIQHKINKENNCLSYERIGVHIPCNTPLFVKKEYLLIPDEYKKAIICEHFLVLAIVYSIANTLGQIDEILDAINSIQGDLYDEIEYIWDIELKRGGRSFFDSIQKYINHEAVVTQKRINKFDSDSFYENALSFSSCVLPFLELMRTIPILEKSHFMIMIDDAHDMNEYQIKALNSWIAYRDHSLFSFKVATAKIDRPTCITSTGGSILEGHDFITVDMEQAYQNTETDFYKLSKQIIEKRLQRIGIDNSVEEFFPINPSLKEDLVKYREQARIEGVKKYGSDNNKAVNDFVYKYHRAMYFRERKDKANKPPYSGFETIVDISTGIIRNMLDPCFWMYAKALNEQNDEAIEFIPPAIQTSIFVERSQRLWDIMEAGLDKVISNCTADDAKHINNLFKNLMALFSQRLKLDISEPRAIVFSISQIDVYPERYNQVLRLLNIARRAQYLYTRTGNAKEKGRQETYYVPNRLLFPSLGLDPHGQYSRASIKIKDLYEAAFNNSPLPLNFSDGKDEPKQLTINYEK